MARRKRTELTSTSVPETPVLPKNWKEFKRAEGGKVAINVANITAFCKSKKHKVLLVATNTATYRLHLSEHYRLVQLCNQIKEKKHSAHEYDDNSDTCIDLTPEEFCNNFNRYFSIFWKTANKFRTFGVPFQEYFESVFGKLPK